MSYLIKIIPLVHENINRLLLFVVSAINIPLAVFHSVSVGTSLLGRDIFIMNDEIQSDLSIISDYNR